MLSFEEGYLAMYFTLDEYWHETKMDWLGALLGTLCPFTFIGAISANPNAFIEWLKFAKKITTNTSLSKDEAFQVSIDFLKLYERGYEIGWVISEFEKQTSKGKRWKKGIRKAKALGWPPKL